jgi:gallate decarboxylase subunit C
VPKLSYASGNRENTSQVTDLRSALELLDSHPGQLVRITEEVDPIEELAGIYKKIGAGTPTKPPTRSGPAALFERVKGYDIRVVAGMLGTRPRIALMLGVSQSGLAQSLLTALQNPVPPDYRSQGKAPCQEIVHSSPIDIRKIIPPLINTKLDAGPYISMGLMRAEDPDTGEADVTIHRLCIQGPDLLTVWFTPGRHIDALRAKAEQRGLPLPVSISIGLDPAIYLASCFEPPTTPLGLDELAIAGALRGTAVELTDCLSVKARAIANAEIVLEGEFLPGRRMREDASTETRYAMPEFTGYMGKAKMDLPVIRVTAITHRRDPILQTIVGPGEEHGNLSGIPMEASILRMVEASMPGRLKNVYAHPSGGGKLLVILQIEKASLSDEGRQRQAALTAFAAFPELKQVILVDPDVDLFDTNDVLWAMTTRYQGDASTVFIPGVRCHPLDPSQVPEFSRSISGEGISCKTIFDCTVPFGLGDQFVRSPFAEVDEGRFLKKEQDVQGPERFDKAMTFLLEGLEEG